MTRDSGKAKSYSCPEKTVLNNAYPTVLLTISNKTSVIISISKHFMMTLRNRIPFGATRTVALLIHLASPKMLQPPSRIKHNVPPPQNGPQPVPVISLVKASPASAQNLQHRALGTATPPQAGRQSSAWAMPPHPCFWRPAPIPELPKRA